MLCSLLFLQEYEHDNRVKEITAFLKCDRKSFCIATRIPKKNGSEFRIHESDCTYMEQEE